MKVMKDRYIKKEDFFSIIRLFEVSKSEIENDWKIYKEQRSYIQEKGRLKSKIRKSSKQSCKWDFFLLTNQIQNFKLINALCAEIKHFRNSVAKHLLELTSDLIEDLRNESTQNMIDRFVSDSFQSIEIH